MEIFNETSIPFHDQFALEPVEGGTPYTVNIVTTPESAGVEIRGHMADGSIYKKEVKGKVSGLSLPLSRRELYVLHLPGLQMYQISQGAEDRPLVKVERAR